MKKSVLIFIAFLFLQTSFAQQKTENLVIVTLDGMRWQEVFKGGEATNCGTLYQAQLATTFAALLGFDFKPDHPAMQPIQQITSK